jgi:hypothetical protein
MKIDWLETRKFAVTLGSVFLFGFAICAGMAMATYIFPQKERENKMTILHSGPGWECDDTEKE